MSMHAIGPQAERAATITLMTLKCREMIRDNTYVERQHCSLFVMYTLTRLPCSMEMKMYCHIWALSW
jgi:hypothetical protein